MRTLIFTIISLCFMLPAHAELYRYKQVSDEYTTYYAEPPRNAEGAADESWYEHCTIDGYTYVTVNVHVPGQNPIIEWEMINPPAQFYQQVKSCSVHVDLMERRVAAGKYMRDDKHIVNGNATQVATWRQSVLEMFGLGN